jgi:branched-chain amino acid transport system permease protein
MPHTPAFLLQQLLNAVQIASFYLPLALAFAIMQAITRRIFLGFGDLAMFGSFAAIYVCFDAMLRGNTDLPSAVYSLIAAIICGAALGSVVGRLMLSRELLKNPLAFMIASIGLSITLEETMRLQSQSKDIWVPPLFSGLYAVEIPGSFSVRLPLMGGLAIVMSLLAVVAVFVFLDRSRFGLYWRACSQSLLLTSLTGVDALWVARWSFALAGGLAAVTGWASAISYGGANYSIGLMVGFKAMFASVIGGFGTLRGAVVGAIALAIMEVTWSSAFSTTYRDVAVFALIIVVLVLKPEGLMGDAHQRESEER